MIHAVSPAVPPEASARVEAYARREGWRLEVIDAGEFADPNYLQNPANRCFFCKTNLYGTIAARSSATICSGTNLDDLADWRPGLQAAEQHRVRHPYVEAGIDKATVRALATHLGLDDLAELPAAPCLSSRLETGLPVTAARLELVHAVERLIQQELMPRTVRCRLLLDGIAIQLDPDALARIEHDAYAGLRAAVERPRGPPWSRPARALSTLSHGQRLPPPRGACLTSPSTFSGASGSASARRCCAPARRRSRSARCWHSPERATPRCC